MKILNDHDWEAYGKLFRAAKPFPSICIDNFLKHEFADQVANSYPTYSSAKPVGREFSSVNEKNKIQVTNPENFPDPVTKLSEALASSGFRNKMTELSGIRNLNWDPTFSGGGMHLTSSSGILDVHVDFNYLDNLDLYRRLNILIYLNPIWEKDWGGEVELWDSEVKNCVHSFEPIHNRCVIFATSDFSFHGVTAVNVPEGISRKSFAAYYYSNEAGDNTGEKHQGKHSTIFKARPSERVKKYWSMPLEKLVRSVEKGKNNAKVCVKKVIGRY